LSVSEIISLKKIKARAGIATNKKPPIFMRPLKNLLYFD